MVQLDIKMPKACYECPCHDGENNSCQVTGKYCYDEILRSCPLIELPSAKPDYTEVLGWLLAYHVKSFELKGRYHPYEAIGWLVHDFAKNFIEQGDQDADND